ncbi:beta-1,3-glucanase family protein [Streptomyces sp. NPDC019208]|uniref:beta-1,3-glucanase family protein n=1 Tax=unclassified Streptomyces TaxID=2593676 RepID=UPI003409D45A
MPPGCGARGGPPGWSARTSRPLRWLRGPSGGGARAAASPLRPAPRRGLRPAPRRSPPPSRELCSPVVNTTGQLVEPSFAADADVIHAKVWSCCEFTFNSVELYANLSCVDLVTAVPIGFTLTGNATRTVAPLELNAAERIAEALRAQAAEDGYPPGTGW